MQKYFTYNFPVRVLPFVNKYNICVEIYLRHREGKQGKIAVKLYFVGFRDSYFIYSFSSVEHTRFFY